MTTVTILPLTGFAPTNTDIANHLREQAEAVDLGQRGDLRNVFMVFETADGALQLQTAGAPCDLARSSGILFAAAARGVV